MKKTAFAANIKTTLTRTATTKKNKNHDVNTFYEAGEKSKCYTLENGKKKWTGV